MLRPGSQDSYISGKVNMPTAKSHAELVSDVEPKIKAQAFFSARVAEAHILDRLRQISDGYSRGEFGLGEARNKLKDFLWAEGYDPHQGGMRNLASTGRLNLILKQNAAMAHSAAEWQRMHDPDAMKVYPYVRYHARSDNRTRSEHAHLDGRIFRKDDPFLSTHTPPGEFNCRCWLEEITEKEAGKTPDLIQPPTPADKVTVDSKSGFSFDPAHAFEEFDYDAIKDAELRAKTRAGVMQMLSQTGPTSQTGQTGQTKDEPETNTGKMAKLIGADMIEGEHTREQDLAATNPNFGKGEEWNKNCQRCVYAYEARRRGIDVEAESRFLTGNDPMDDHWKEICSGMQWQQPNEITSQGTKRAIDTAMTGFGNGSRAVVFVEWEGVDPPASHVFIAENVDGKIVYVDPQNNDDNVESNFWIAIPEKTEFARLDNLDFSNYIKLCCKRREP